LDSILQPFAAQFSPDEWARGKSHFQNSFLFIWPPSRRQAMVDLYAYCRPVDDLADETLLPQNQRNHALAEVESWIDQQQPCGHVFWDRYLNEIQRFKIPSSALLGILAGVRRDLQNPQLSFDTWADLEGYIHQVSGCVGICVLSIMGSHGDQAIEYATHMGRFVQYINIMRDLEDDLRERKVFLPKTFLRENGIDLSASDPSSIAYCREALLSRALEARKKAIPYSRSCLVPELMASIYREGAFKYWRYGLSTRLSSLEKTAAIVTTALQFVLDRKSLNSSLV